MWIINAILFIIGAVAAVMGISFFIRNREAESNVRFYILLCGVSSAFWCFGYATVGIAPDPSICGMIRKIAVLGVCSFLATETLLVTEMSGVRKEVVLPAKIIAIAVSIPDFFIYSESEVDIFLRVHGRIAWYANPAFVFHRRFHLFYMLLMILLMLSFGIIWIVKSKLKRRRRFLYLVLAANLLMFLFSLPDTFITARGGYAVPTSGIGAAFCAIILWYGAIQLNLFDIRSGNIKDRVFDFIDAGIIVFDADQRITLLNNYARSLVKDSTEKGPQIGDFFAVDATTEEEMFRGARKEIYALRLSDREGKRSWSVRVRAVDDTYGDLFCYMCVFMDITSEAETAKKLEYANQAKSRFLAQMSHEIRTPINAVLGMNEMILRRSTDTEILEYAENIDSAGNTLLALINSILDFSKIEDGKMELIRVRYDMASLINDLYHSIIQRVEAKGLSFTVDADESLPSALIGDDVRLSQVIMNLLTNAVKYTEKGGITLSVRTDKRDGDTVSVRIAVKDTGIGIRSEDMDRLFISFERLDEVRNRNIEGTGLGITIVKNLLAMMGSTLQVESTYGEGSVFSFVVEQRIADESPIGDYRQRLAEGIDRKDKADLISAPDARILVVDDNEMNRKVAKGLLKLCDIEADLAVSGEDTIACMKRKKYDIVFLDYMMPGMDGIETLSRLREEKLIPEGTTMIAMTANAIVGAKENYLAAGFNDYLSKPVEIGCLIGQLKKYLRDGTWRSLADSGVRDDTARLPADPSTVSSGEEDEILEFSPWEEGSRTENPTGSYDPEKLAACGIDTRAGLAYCANEEGMYLEMLSDFAVSCEEKGKTIDGFFREARWRDYQVAVHALKSNARMVGLSGIFEQAKALEEAAQKMDIDYIGKHHEQLLSDAAEAADGIRAAISM